MELTTFIKTIEVAIKSTQALRSYIEGGEIGKILSAVGDSHFLAAKEAFSDRVKSNNPEREVIMAITQLRVGFKAYINGKSSTNLRKAYQSACLIIVFYLYLGDDNLAKEWLKRCNEAFNKYLERRDWEWTILTPDIPVVRDSLAARGGIGKYAFWGVWRLVGNVIKVASSKLSTPEMVKKEKESHNNFINQYENMKK